MSGDMNTSGNYGYFQLTMPFGGERQKVKNPLLLNGGDNIRLTSFQNEDHTDTRPLDSIMQRDNTPGMVSVKYTLGE